MDIQPARHSVSVSGVIPDDHGRVLLIRRRDNQHWEPPGGVLELDETIHDGLRREIREETGLDIEPDALTGVYKNMPRGIIALVFRCKITGGQLAVNDEVTAARRPSARRNRTVRLRHRIYRAALPNLAVFDQGGPAARDRRPGASGGLCVEGRAAR